MLLPFLQLPSMNLIPKTTTLLENEYLSVRRPITHTFTERSFSLIRTTYSNVLDMLGLKPSHSVSDLRAFLDSGFVETEGHASKFIQVLDESMCVVREDLTDWLQRYLFSSANATPIGPPFLLFRLGSGLWLSRLAYKLHLSVLQPCSASNQPSGHKKTQYGFLRGAVSNQNLNTISKFSLPPFPHTLVMCAKLPLGPADTCALPLTDLSSGNVAASSANSLPHSPLPSSQTLGSDSVDAVHLPKLRHADRWIARDNVSCFIQWCKDLGIPQTVLFETTGLVHRTEEKNVLLTLMELARIASRFGLTDLPELVRMEREIDALELERQRQTKSEAESYCSDSMDHSNSSRKQIRLNGDEITPNENSQHAVKNCDLVKHPYPSEYADGTAADDSGLDYTSSDMDDEIHSRSDKSVDGTTLFQRSRVTQSTCPSGDQQLAVGCTQTTPVQTLNSDSVSRKNTGTCCSDKSSDDSKTPIRRQSDPFVVEQPTTITRRPLLKLGSGDFHLLMSPSHKLSQVHRRSSEKRKLSFVTPEPTFDATLSVDHTPAKLLKSTSLSDSVTVECTLYDHTNYLKVSHEHEGVLTPTTALRSLHLVSTESFVSHPEESKHVTSDSYVSNSHQALGKTTLKYEDNIVEEQVSKHLALCTCCNRLRMQRLEEGRYRLGNRLYYLRRFRNHVMVRVGGGWLTLDEFLNRHDPCRRGRDVVLSRSRAQSPAPSLHEVVQEPTMPEVRKPMLPVSDVLSPAKLRRRWSKNSTSSSESHSSDHSLGSNISVRNRPHSGRLLSNPKLSVPHQIASKNDSKLQVASSPRASSLTCLPESTSTHIPPRSATPTALKQLTSSTERLSTRTPTHTSVRKTSLGEPNSRTASRSRVISTTPPNPSDTSTNMPPKKTVQSSPQTGLRPPATNRQRDQISHTRGTSRPTVSAGVSTARSPRDARDKSEKRPSFRPVAS
ncbi:hypothetical protein PHET_00653 [Paragonimus heterotremus]|uniref:GAR domain-containing protein n=1 Tax=Paragonimus heterotremus TaxID=100268 RepID=A0A8J4WKX7_9TREM|nr:hypothetical protein PHET_00653 [Paragonimus heterotremus]